MGPRTRVARRLLAAWHRLAGRVCFRAGRLCRAHDHFERVLELIGDDCTSHVFLGCIAYACGDYRGWQRRFELARRAAPRQFARLRDTFDLPVPRTDAIERNHRAAESGQVAERARSAWPTRPTASWVDDVWEDVEPPRDDFASETERQKFQNLGPIPLEDIYAVDLDELARRLAC